MNNSYRNNNQSSDIVDSQRPDIYNDESDFTDSPSKETEALSSQDLLTKYNETINRDNSNHTSPVKITSKKTDKKKPKKLFRKTLAILLAILVAIIILGFIISLTLPTKTSFLLMATDQDGTRTDTIMYGVFDKNTKKISLLSIPRDTYVTVDDDVYAKMNKEYPQPGSKSMKINAVHHFGGEKYGTDLIVNQVEHLVENKVNFYVKVNFSTFRYIIDAVGGVDFYVPQNMEYHDPLQNLHISLTEGQQHLNGEQAEQVLRYRSGYANADLGRVDVQQQFIKAFISQVFSAKTILSKPTVFVSILANDKYIDTNFNLIDAIPYAFSIIGLDTASMDSQTLPGRAGSAGGQSVYYYYESECEKIIAEMMN